MTPPPLRPLRVNTVVQAVIQDDWVRREADQAETRVFLPENIV